MGFLELFDKGNDLFQIDEQRTVVLYVRNLIPSKCTVLGFHGTFLTGYGQTLAVLEHNLNLTVFHCQNTSSFDNDIGNIGQLETIKEAYTVNDLLRSVFLHSLIELLGALSVDTVGATP